MSISNLISLLSGIALFLFGMSLMGDGLKKVAGNKLEVILYQLTGKPLKGFLLGTAVTAVIQSSSATSVMVVGFVNSGMMRVRNQAAHIQREDGLILQCLRHLAGDNPLRQTFDDCRLADARFADENGVIFRFPGQNADHVSDFLITTDDGVHLLLACALDKIGAVFLQRLIGVLRGIGGHALVAADGLQRLQKTLFCNVIGGEQAL